MTFFSVMTIPLSHKGLLDLLSEVKTNFQHIHSQDDDLLHAVLTHGRNWATIASTHKPSRTTLALKNRYSTLRLKHDNKNKANGKVTKTTQSANVTSRKDMDEEEGVRSSDENDEDEDRDMDSDDSNEYEASQDRGIGDTRTNPENFDTSMTTDTSEPNGTVLENEAREAKSPEPSLMNQGSWPARNEVPLHNPTAICETPVMVDAPNQDTLYDTSDLIYTSSNNFSSQDPNAKSTYFTIHDQGRMSETLPFAPHGTDLLSPKQFHQPK